MLRAEPLKLSEAGLEGFEVELGSERERVDLMFQLELFEFEEGIDGREV